MRSRLRPVEALLTLPRLASEDERRATWRQAITALGASPRITGPPPLDELDPQLVHRAVQVALDSGLCDDLDWITPGKAAVALYELTAALPPGRERRGLGRRVFARLYEGQAGTFVAVATRMALGSAKPLEAATIRARIGLAFDLPIGSSVNADPLALALVSRRELLQRWVVAASTGALPQRRVAAKLLEHAAREAMTMVQQGDHHPRKLLASELVMPAFRRLLADREPLVWRHAAVARGLLASANKKLQGEIEHGLDPGLDPTAWRRAAVSVVATMVCDPTTGLEHCRGLLESELIGRDPGIAAVMVWGLPRVIEAEPDAAEELLNHLSVVRRPDVAEAVTELLSDVAHPTFGTEARKILRAVLGSTSTTDSPALRAITEQALRELERSTEETTITASVQRAIQAFETVGAREAYDQALEAAQNAEREVIEIAALDPDDESTLPAMLTLLADLDANVLERNRLGNLLLLGRRPGDTDTTVPEMDRLYDTIGTWTLDAEEDSEEAEEWTQVRTLTRRRRLKALLHLLDLETAGQTENDRGTERVRTRLRRAIDVLLSKLASGPDGAIHRILSASLARSLDAAVREGLADPSDVLLLVAAALTDQESIAAIAEASTNPDVRGPIASFNRFVEGTGIDPMDDETTGVTGAHVFSVAGELSADAAFNARSVLTLSAGLGAGGTYRGEALRQVVLALGRALEAVAVARGLDDLTDTTQSGTDPLLEAEMACDDLRRLVAGAKRRVLGEDTRSEDIDVVADVASCSALVARAATGVPPNAQQFAMSVTEMVADLPPSIASAVWTVLGRIPSLPVQAASDVYAIPLEKRRPALPGWLLPRRTIGAFYVTRALGTGGVSSVFVARRYEDRHDKGAENFALKVPQYDPTTARQLSEQEFMELFREEAGALLALPAHPNLARFVTFDLAARPRPILVMELIEGVGLDRLIRSRALDVPRALDYLDGMLSGLGAMHQVGVGHLDVKPSNVILRNEETPVLVDFGLSGRTLRPGCGTLEYVAPEVLGVVPRKHRPSPIPADLYSFACTAFEVLTAELLFDAEDEMALMSHHVAHDGWPPRLANLASVPGLGDLCVVLAACLRRDPRDRPDAAATQQALHGVAKQLADWSWPLQPTQAAQAG